MAYYDLKTFTNKAAADAYFVNVIKNDNGAAAILFKASGHITYSHENAPPQDLGPNNAVHLVLRLSPGTKIEADQVMIESQVAGGGAAVAEE